MKLDYYFWDNLKKQGYNDGKLFQPLYKKLIEQQDIKEIDNLITKRTDEILKNQKNQSEKTISTLASNLEEIKHHKSLVEQDKNEDKKEILEKYKNNKQKLDEDYKFYISSDLEVIRNINQKLYLFYEHITDYTKNAKENIQHNINKILDYFTNSQKEIESISQQEAKKILDENIDNYINIKNDNRIEYTKDIIMLVFLGIIFIFDSILGYKVIKEIFIGPLDGFFLEFVSIFISIAMIILIVGLTHYILKAVKETDNNNEKYIYVFMLIIILGILIRYITLSNRELSLIQLFSNQNGNAMETLIRSLLIPALIGGEIIIERINWNNIFLYFKKLGQPFRYVRGLLAKQMYIIKNNKVITYIEEEEKVISEKIQEINSNIENNIAFSKILETVDNVKSLLGPIYEQHESKIQEYESKKQNIENQKNLRLQEIESNYSIKKEKYDARIDEIENQIRLIKQQLGDAENSIGSGIKIGLTS